MSGSSCTGWLSRLVVLVVTALMVTTGSAAAGTYLGKDARGDVRGTAVGVPVRQEAADAATRRLGDIVSFRVSYTASVVRIAVRMAELSRSQGPHYYWFPVRTPSGENMVFLNAGPGGHAVPQQYPWRGSTPRLYTGTRNPAVWGPNADEPRQCRIRRSIDYRRNRVVVAVPAACLGAPAWIRAGASVKTQAQSRVRSYSDVALVRGRPGAVVYSPRVLPGPAANAR